MITADVPLITVACSGWDDKKMVRESLEAGMVHYLTKPFIARNLAALWGF